MPSDSDTGPSAAEILGLPGVVTGPAEVDRWGRLVVPLRLDGCPDVLAGGRRCPACRNRRPAVGTYGHFPLAGRPCRVRLTVAPCPRGAVATALHAAFLEDWGMTAGLFEHLAFWVCAEPLAKVAQQTGLARAKLAHTLTALEAAVAVPFRGKAPRYLGLDGVHILGHTHTTLADLGTGGRLVELAEKHSPAAIRAALRRLEPLGDTGTKAFHFLRTTADMLLAPRRLQPQFRAISALPPAHSEGGGLRSQHSNCQRSSRLPVTRCR